MPGLLKLKIKLGFIINPFYLYCISFSLAIFVYLWGWCNLFPKLSGSLIMFFIMAFILFILAGYKIKFNVSVHLANSESYHNLNDIIFFVIFLMGLINILLMGFLPIFDTTHDYREYGVHIIDPIFNTMSIFFSVYYFQSFLESKKKRFLIYVIVILILQILIFRRATIIWIITSSSFLFLIYKNRISILVLLVGIISIPFLSFYFGLYGNTRSNLSKSYVLNDLGASDSFKRTGVSHNNYMTYLYVSSPLANLQKNIIESVEKLNFKNFFFYCIVPQSVTLRLEKYLNTAPPECRLITPDLIVGTFLMVGFFTLGWPGMFIMLFFLFIFILICKSIIEKFNTFYLTTYCILSTTVSLLIFSNFLNRFDVILMLFIYPVLFHFIYKKGKAFLNIKHETIIAG